MISDAKFTEMAEAWSASLERIKNDQASLRREITDVSQRHARAPSGYGGGNSVGELADLIFKSDGCIAFAKGSTPSFTMQIPSRLLATKAVINEGDQALVQSDRGPVYIAVAPQRRLTIRALFSAYPTQSDSIERTIEGTFTDNSDFQGGTSSPTGSGESALKNESQVTFSLERTTIPTIAHYIVASRQILSDSRLLQSHLERRLIYFLNLKEETEFLTGTNQITGINQSASAFSGGGTNQTRLDTLARAANQLAVGSYDPRGFILHPTDWLECQLEKDSQNRYVLGDPAAQQMPSVWGLPVVPTASQTLGTFTCLDAARYGFVADREDATVRISENVNDAFIRNLVHLLAEKRTALITEVGAAAVTGSIATPG